MVTKIDKEFTTEDLIAELQQYQQPAPPRRTTAKGEACGVTIREWEEKQGVSDTSARKDLNKLVSRGILEKVWTLCPDGQRRFVYYRIENK
jgi:Fic family protein